MSKAYDFIRECGAYFLLTENEGFPAGRPFGAIVEIDDDLYVSTSDLKAVYKQLKVNGNVQLLALKADTREWVRVTGIATECESVEMKEKMLEKCPGLKKYHLSGDEPHFNAFKIKVLETEFH